MFFNEKNYREQQQLKIDKEMLEYRLKLAKDLEEFALLCAKQKGDYEHTFHEAQERLSAEIKLLEKTKDNILHEVNTLNEIIALKDEEISRLHVLVNNIVKDNKTVINK